MEEAKNTRKNNQALLNILQKGSQKPQESFWTSTVKRMKNLINSGIKNAEEIYDKDFRPIVESARKAFGSISCKDLDEHVNECSQLLSSVCHLR